MPPVLITTTPTPAVTLLLINLLIGSLLDLLLIGIIKHLDQRLRPLYDMFHSFAVDHWSFPSGHSSRVSFIATFCSIYFDQIADFWLVKLRNLDSESWIAEHFVLMVGLWLWAAVTSASWVLFGRNFMLDIVGGSSGCPGRVLVFREFSFENLSFWLR